MTMITPDMMRIGCSTDHSFNPPAYNRRPDNAVADAPIKEIQEVGVQTELLTPPVTPTVEIEDELTSP